MGKHIFINFQYEQDSLGRRQSTYVIRISLSKDNKTGWVVLIVNTLNLDRLELKPISNRYFIIRKGVSFNVKRFGLGLKF